MGSNKVIGSLPSEECELEDKEECWRFETLDLDLDLGWRYDEGMTLIVCYLCIRKQIEWTY